MPFEDVFYELGDQLQHVYFPTTLNIIAAHHHLRSCGIVCSSETTNTNDHSETVQMTTKQNQLANSILAALPAADFEHISPYLEEVEMPLGEVLYESGMQLQHIYFPTTAIVSKCYVMENGASSEIVGVGNEGVIGTHLLMGGITQPSHAIVYTGGHGFRIKARVLKEEFERAGGRRSGALQTLILLYNQARITQVSQTAVCNRHHSLEQRLCRWLLQTLDRLQTNELTMTQELIASLLGVRRESITEVAGHLQQEELIRYRRGKITILDRPGLESHACECYMVVKKVFDQLFPAPASSKANLSVRSSIGSINPIFTQKTPPQH